jgi:hypothetical protein
MGKRRFKMKIYESNIRVFYNKDCGKYGVEKIVKGITLHCKDGIKRQLYKWSQVPVGDKTYTPYKKVAERWAEIARDKTVISITADMEEEF